MLETFKTDTFRQEVLASDTPVLVDFWAPWCSHCLALEPVLEEFARDMPQVRVGKVNVDEEPALAREYGILSIPTVLCIRNGKISAKKTAPKDPEELESMIH